MTPPDPKPAAPPTVAPASDEEISRHKHCHRICDGSERCVCGHELSGVTHYALVARIEADRAENDRLRARVAELEEGLRRIVILAEKQERYEILFIARGTLSSKPEPR